ncbi:putative protein ycf68 [Sesamum alatum]|uniref:Uncharacterized protein ycf68 n=1 Tax=Sesamum alatum TaxID=300844 RepID=A0AAE2CTZ2_9LAMI|nr:putative protein ycf68 [Sesamum alatum]
MAQTPMGGSSAEFSAMGESLTEQCRVEVEGLWVVNFFSRRRINDASVDGFLSPPSNPRAQPWIGGGNYQAGTAGDKPEEGEDDVKSSCPLCPGRHTCYNGRDKGSRSREGELTQKPVLSSDCRLQLACMKPESLVIAGQPYGGEFVPGPCAHCPRNKVAVLEGAAGSPPFHGKLMLVGYFGLTLLHTQNKKKGATSELNLEMEVFFHFSTRAPSGRLARRAISSVVERAPDNCVVVPGLRIDRAIRVRSNVDPTFASLVGSERSGGDHHGSSLLENPYIPYLCMDSYLSSTGLGSASMGKENGAPNNASSQTKNYEITPFILG